MKPALLIIDLQKAFHKDIAARTMDEAVMVINRAIPLFRESGLPVIWIQHIDEYDGALPGKPAFDFIEGLAEGKDELHIHKTYNNSFNKTALADQLAAAGIDTVVLAGYCAEFCVIATYWGAKNLDLQPFVLRGGIASDIARNIGFVEELTATRGLAELEELMRPGRG